MLFKNEKNSNEIENHYNAESALEILHKLHLMNTYLTLKSKSSLVSKHKIT